MTETVLKEIVRRAVNDQAFRGQLRSDPAKALAGLGLTAEERSAVTSGDPAKLTALGVDQRMSKVFSAGFLSEASKVVIGDPDPIGSGVFVDDKTSGSAGGVTGDPAAPATAAADADSAFGRHLWRVEQDLNTAAVAEAAGGVDTSTSDHIRRVEQDLDAGSSLEAPASTATSDHIRLVEQDLDAGSSVETPPDDTLGGGSSIHPY